MLKLKSESINKLIKSLDSGHIKTYFYYRELRTINETIQKNICNEILKNFENEVLIKLDDSNYFVLKKSDFNSNFYKKNIWKIEFLHSTSSENTLELLSLLKKTRRELKFEFLTIDVDSRDKVLIASLEGLGFYKATSKNTCILYASQFDVTKLGKHISRVDFSNKDDEDEVKRLISEYMTSSTLGDDQNIVNEIQENIYPVWVEKAYSGEWADRIVCAKRKNEIKAFFSYRYDRLFEIVTGKKITDHTGLAFGTKDAPGACVNAADFILENEFKRGLHAIIFETRITNKTVNKYFKKRDFVLLGVKEIYNKLFV